MVRGIGEKSESKFSNGLPMPDILLTHPNAMVCDSGVLKPLSVSQVIKECHESHGSSVNGTHCLVFCCSIVTQSARNNLLIMRKAFWTIKY